MERSVEAPAAAQRTFAQLLRQRLADELPLELDTEFQIERWFRSYSGDIQLAERRVLEYLANRRALGYDRPDFMERFFELDCINAVLPFIAVSNLADRCVDENNDRLIFVQRLENNDFSQALKVVPTGVWLKAYFGMHEFLLRLILRREKRTGRKTSYWVLFDLKGAAIGEHINPLGSVHRFDLLCMHLLRLWFGQQISKLLIINPPPALKLIWTLVKSLLGEEALAKVTTVPRLELLKELLPAHCLPMAFGGSVRDDSGWGDAETCCSIPNKPTQPYVIGRMFAKLGLDKCRDAWQEASIKAGETFTLTKSIQESNLVMAWQYQCGASVEFSVVRVEEDSEEHKETLVYPKFTTYSLVLPEEDFIECERAGVYRLLFSNVGSSWFSTSLKYRVAFGPAQTE